MSGLALLMASVGGYAVYAGLNNVPFTSGLRELVSGKLPAPREPKRTTVNWSAPAAGADGGAGAGSSGATGNRIADAARKYLGIPYVWAAHDPSKGFDCSGLVTWVLHHDLGINLPNNTHTVTGQFMVWGGATTIPKSQCAAGDLIVWPGHIGIAVSPTQMIHAPTSGEVVKIGNIWWTPQPLVRRVMGSTPGVPSSRGPL